MWFDLPTHMSAPCASEGCLNPATFRLEAEGVASNYCGNCRLKIAGRNQWLNLEYRDMTDRELSEAHQYWAVHVEEASGWPSAYFSAKQLKHIVAEGTSRGMRMVNPHPIRVG